MFPLTWSDRNNGTKKRGDSVRQSAIIAFSQERNLRHGRKRRKKGGTFFRGRVPYLFYVGVSFAFLFFVILHL